MPCVRDSIQASSVPSRLTDPPAFLFFLDLDTFEENQSVVV